MPVVFDSVSERELVELERADRRALSTVAVRFQLILPDTHLADLVAPRHSLVEKFFWQTSSSGGAHFLPLVSTGPYILLTSVLKLRAASAHRLADPSAAAELDKTIVAEVLALALLADVSKGNPTHAQGVNESAWRAFAAAANGADLVAARDFVERGALGVDVAQLAATWCRAHMRDDARSRSPVAAKSIKHALDWVKNVLQVRRMVPFSFPCSALARRRHRPADSRPLARPQSAPEIHGQGRSVPPPAVEPRSLGKTSSERFVPRARRIAPGL